MEEGDHHLVFAVNGEKFDLQDFDPSTTLLEFLRSQTRFKSVKLGCGEGGCGACVVVLSKYDHSSKQLESYAVSSCLTLLCSVNGCSIITSEGLGNSKDGFHTIHQRFAGFHASQCGFCTPGMCMSIFSALVKADYGSNQLEPSPGFSNLSVAKAEKIISGNLCRCTGYRPIADVCKSFSRDVDIEDLGLNSFWTKRDSKEMKVSRLPFYDPNHQNYAFPQFLKKELKPPVALHSKSGSWYIPQSIKELQGLLELFDDAQVKLVVSNTGAGYYKEMKKYDRYIDLRCIKELSSIKRDHTGISIGAAVSISKAIELLNGENSHSVNNETTMMFRKIANHFEKVASTFIRNSGSIGGNLVMAQRNHFPSDLATVLLAVGSTVDIIAGLKQETLMLGEFLEAPALNSKSLLVSVKIPYWKPFCDSHSGTNSALIFETYRASPRPLGNALPYLSAAFWVEASLNSCFNGFVINHIRLAFGAFGGKHAIRARNVEDFLIGKTLDDDVLYDAIKLVQASVVPEYGTLHASYRSSLASAFLFQFLQPLIESCAEKSYARLNGCTETISSILNAVAEKYEEFKVNNENPILLPAKQAIGPPGEYRPVGEPIIKTGAALQASGEAVFVDDIPLPPNSLHGAFIYSTKPLAKVKEIKFKSELVPEGVEAIISFKDIPKGGENIGSDTTLATEPLFAEDITICAGQPIALVVANTQKQADMAANLAVVDYDFENLDPPVLTVEEAVERSSFFEIYPFVRPKHVGKFSQGMDEAEHKIVSAEIRLPSQYYFYMESQSALAIPDEDDCMLVYSSSQAPEISHSVIARCLGIPWSNVRVITRRVGGGFGGKAFRSIPTATACALAAYTLHRPVRIYQNRKTDMIMAGGRHPMKITYTVGFKSDGKVTALHLNILLNAGISEDWSPFLPTTILGSLKKYNWGALSFDFKVCKTNNISRSAMRAPGELQGSFIAEAIIENVASSLSIDVDNVREKNFHSFESLQFFYSETGGDEPNDYTLRLIWDKLGTSSSYDKRRLMIKEFNESHMWKKRGISRIPAIMVVTVRATPGRVSILKDGSIVVEVGGVDIGQGLWTKVKQMAAFALGLTQCSGAEKLLEKVRVVQADTLSMIQGGMTAGSTTSEASCAAVKMCCEVLVERLNLFGKKMQKQMGLVNWETLIAQAHLESVNLSASSFYVPDVSFAGYLNYGGVVSEVELNLLTGETTILRSDIVYDCGQSLNPAVDLGQIEGSFTQGIGFFMKEEYLFNSDGLAIVDGTWNYKIPTLDTVPKQLNVEVLNSGHHQHRVLSSKASGEPPLLLAASVHCATRAAVKEAWKQIDSWGGNDIQRDSVFQLSVPATMPVVKELCGLDIVEKYLNYKLAGRKTNVLFNSSGAPTEAH